MTIRKSAMGSARTLIAASLGLWVGSAVGAPLAVSYPGRSVALVAATQQDREDVADLGRHNLMRKDLRRQVVDYVTVAAAGTIIIDTAHTYLYYVLGDGTAIRNGIRVGTDGFAWSGAQAVTRMAEWPDWTPPTEMIMRQPYLPRWMAGGTGNPLGARAIYLGSTVYRIHGTNAPATIGTRVSSGCIRLTNADVIDLYGRVTVGAKVIVLPNHSKVVRASAPIRVAAPRTAGQRTTGIY